MNFILGESVVAHMFDQSEQTLVGNDCYMIQNKDYFGFAYLWGKTMKRGVIDYANFMKTRDMSRFKEMIFMMGGNDFVVATHKVMDLELAVKNFMAFVSDAAKQYEFPRAFVVPTYYANRKAEKLLCETIKHPYANFEEAMAQCKVVIDLMIEEASKYDNIHIINLSNIFTKDGQMMHDDYASDDGIHFNEIGKAMYWNALNDGLRSVIQSQVY